MLRLLLAIGAPAAVLLSTDAAAAAAVTSISVEAQPAQFSGDCPAALEFVATVAVSEAPVTLEYQWQRSDGSHSSVRRIQARRGLQRITDEWAVGREPGHHAVWERILILTPSRIRSAAAKASVDCR